MINVSTNLNTFPILILRPPTHAGGSRPIHLELNELLFASGDGWHAIVTEQNSPHSELDQGRSAFAVPAGEQRSVVNGEAS